MHFSLWETPKFTQHFVISLIFIQLQIHEIRPLRLSHGKFCPFGNYFTDGCVSCWCDPGNGQRVCENMISCPRKNVKCPMGSKYQDECSNDCTCYENTGAIFCKEKGPCNSIKRRNTFQAPPPPPMPLPAPPTPNINRMDSDIQALNFGTIRNPEKFANHHRSHAIDDVIPANLEHQRHDTFQIPNPVPIHKEDLIIEPALIIRRKSFKGQGQDGDKNGQKHPTTLLYLYEKQLKSMKDFKSYYKHYLNSQQSQNQDHKFPNQIEASPARVKEIIPKNYSQNQNQQNQIVSLFSASSNVKPKFLLPSKTNTNLVPIRRNQLEIEIPVRNFNSASSMSMSTTPRPRQDFHYIFRNMKESQALGSMSRPRSTPRSRVTPKNSQYLPMTPTSPRPSIESALNLTPNMTYPPQNSNLFLDKQLMPQSSELLPSLETYTTTKSSIPVPEPRNVTMTEKYPLVTVFNVFSTTSRPNVKTKFKYQAQSAQPKIHQHKYFGTGTTSRPQFISYVTPERSTPTPPPPPRSYSPSGIENDQKGSASYPSLDHRVVHAELNKPIFVNHIVATRRYPEIYGGQGQIHDPYHPSPPPPTHRPKQYRLFVKSEDKKPFFYSDRNRVPLFVDKIAREFFRKPAIFVPKIKTVRGQPQLELNRVVYNHKEMIPKELILEPGGSPVKVKFTPEAERDMNREWMEALQEQQMSKVKVEQSLGYRKKKPEVDYHHSFHSHSKSQDHTQYPTPYPEDIYREEPQNPKTVSHHVFQEHTEQHYSPNDPFAHDSGSDFIQELIRGQQDDLQLPMPDPIPIPPYDSYPSLGSFSPSFPSSPYDEEIVHSSPSYPSSSPLDLGHGLDYPVIEQPPPDYGGGGSPQLVFMEQGHSQVKPTYSRPHPHPTATEPEGDHFPVSVSPRPDPQQTFEPYPNHSMDDFASYSTSGYFADMLPQPSNDHQSNYDNAKTMLIDSIKKADELPQKTSERPRIRIQDVLAHKRGPNENKNIPLHIRIRPEIDSIYSSTTTISTTTTPTTTTTTATTTPAPTTPTPTDGATTEEFNAEKILREILALDPEIGPDAVLYRENGETIPPLHDLTSTTTTTSPTPTYVPHIKSKGDFGILPQDFDPEIWLTSTTPPPRNPNRSPISSTVDPLSFEQFYQDLFRPQKKREEEVTERVELIPVKKPVGFVDADGVAKIFRYDSIIKTFKTGDSVEEKVEEKVGMEKEFRNIEKREDEVENRNRAKFKGKSDKRGRKSDKKKKTIENDNPKTEATTPSTEKAIQSTTIIPEPKSEDSLKDDPSSSFKRELDWKSKLMADICTTNPDSALCFTYKSLCMLMSS